MKKHFRLPPTLLGLLPMAVTALFLLSFITTLSNLSGAQDQESQRQLEDSLRRAAVACYAIEGIYPPSVEYMEQHYGLQIDRERYVIYYDIFGSNLMPDITVLEKKS